MNKHPLPLACTSLIITNYNERLLADLNLYFHVHVLSVNCTHDSKLNYALSES